MDLIRKFAAAEIIGNRLLAFWDEYPSGRVTIDTGDGRGRMSFSSLVEMLEGMDEFIIAGPRLTK